jgi:hypothetical protein
MKTLLLHILNKIFPPEKPSESELFSYIREQVQQEQQHIYLLEHLCPEHGIALQEVKPGEWKCPTPHRIPAITPQQGQQQPNPYQQQLDYMNRQRASQQALNHHSEQMLRKTILQKPSISEVPTDKINDLSQQKTEYGIPAVNPTPHKAQQLPRILAVQEILPDKVGTSCDPFLCDRAVDPDETQRYKTVPFRKAS